MATASVQTFESVVQLIAAAQTEIAILAIAVCAHVLLFGKHSALVPRKTRGRHIDEPSVQSASSHAQGRKAPDAGSLSVSMKTALEAATQAGDLESGLSCLAQLRQERLPPCIQASVQQLVQLAIQRQAVPNLLERLKASANGKDPSFYNVVLEVCIQSRAPAAAGQVLAAAVDAGAADVVTYNTMVKLHLASGDLQLARAVVKAMREQGLQPNVVTYNELLDAAVSADAGSACRVVGEMQASGLRPNRITCSILLKCVQPGRNDACANRALATLEQMDDEMDEVLLSSSLEACIRVSRTDLLRRLLHRYRGCHRLQVTGAHAYGSIIRAFGFIGDAAGVRESWQEMRARQIPPTCITLGCAVEGLASNGNPDAAHELLREVVADPQTRGVANAVTYSSVLKGFARQKQFDRVWAVYEEMLAADLQSQFTSVTYNTVIDACARCGEAARTHQLLEDMIKQGIEPNLVTYSAVLKGYCHENQLDRAFELFETMRRSKHARPDEQAYNIILDGCARQSASRRGMEVYEGMKASGVQPSNFTLSILVKLAHRGRQLEVAFALCDEFREKHKVRPNVHVYNNLVQACTCQKDFQRAFGVLETMVKEGVRTDSRTFALLIRGFLSVGDARAAGAALRSAFGLRGGHQQLARHGEAARPQDTLSPDVITEALEGMARHCRAEDLASQLLEELRCLPGVRLSPSLSARLARKATSRP